MTYAQIAGVIRAIAAAIGGGLVTKGIVSPDQASHGVDAIVELIGAASFLGSTAWSVYSNHKSQLASQLRKSTQPLSEQVK